MDENEQIKRLQGMIVELHTANSRLKQTLQVASNLIADDLTDSTEKDAPEHFRFLRDAAELLAAN